MIKGLVPGTYHWGVQAIDTAFAGSPFASEVTVALNQGAGCSWTLDPTAASVGSGAGTGTVGVATRADCFWAAVSNDAWITVTGTASGWGDGAVSYSVALNSGPARTGTITIADQTFTVSQAESTFTDIGAAMTGVYGSVAWGDYDNDGDLDVLVAGGIGSGPISKVYRNDGAGAFTDIGAALTGVDGAVAWGDYDNDGDLDILLAGSDGANRVAKLYRNDGGGAFTEISAGLTGVSGAAVAWGDYDNDGDLDILLTGYVGSNVGISKVYRNDGGGVFTDIGAALTGVFAGSVAWGDYDSDGDLDILLAGWVPFSTRLAKVYRNDGGGVFTDTGAALTGVAYSSVAWGDYDNDGDLDILLAGATVSNYVSHVYRNDGSDVFTDVGAALTGVASGSVAWGDYDNDGDLDILLAGMGFSPPDSGRVQGVPERRGGGIHRRRGGVQRYPRAVRGVGGLRQRRTPGRPAGGRHRQPLVYQGLAGVARSRIDGEHGSRHTDRPRRRHRDRPGDAELERVDRRRNTGGWPHLQRPPRQHARRDADRLAPGLPGVRLPRRCATGERGAPYDGGDQGARTRDVLLECASHRHGFHGLSFRE